MNEAGSDAAGRWVLTKCTVLDGSGAQPLKDAEITIVAGRIEAIGRSGSSPLRPHTPELDLGGLFVMPGLIDCHLHTVGGNTWDVQERMVSPPSMSVIRAVNNLRETLDAGVTSIRDAGGADLGMKQAVEQGLIAGPRMRIAINILTQTGGHADGLQPSGDRIDLFETPGLVGGICDGPDEVRKRTREMLRAGADVVKICASGGLGSSRTDPDVAEFTTEEIAAAVEEAHRAGKKVMAHAEGESGIWNALRAGVDSIEHGYSLSERCASLMARQGTFLVPTLTAIPRAPEELREVPAHVAAKAAILGPRSETAFRTALETGVRIAMGTDAGTSRQGANSVELAAMVALGMSPMEAIVSATSRAAECVGVETSVGRLEPGKLADLVAVDGDPLADISCLQDRARLVIVMKGGDMHRNQFAA